MFERSAKIKEWEERIHIFATFREISLKQFSRIAVHPICYISLAAFAYSTNGSTVIELTQICNKYNLTPRHSFPLSKVEHGSVAFRTKYTLSHDSRKRLQNKESQMKPNIE